MGKIGGAVKGINVPAIVAATVVQPAFFAENIVRGPAGANPFQDELFRIAVGDRDQINVAFVFNLDTLTEVVLQHRAGLACNVGHRRNELAVLFHFCIVVPSAARNLVFTPYQAPGSRCYFFSSAMYMISCLKMNKLGPSSR